MWLWAQWAEGPLMRPTMVQMVAVIAGGTVAPRDVGRVANLAVRSNGDDIGLRLYLPPPRPHQMTKSCSMTVTMSSMRRIMRTWLRLG